MNNTTLAILSALLASGATIGAGYVLKPSSTGPAASTDVDELRTALRRLEDRQQKLEQNVAAAPAGSASGALQRTAAPGVSDEEIGAAVQRYLASHAAAAGVTDAAGRPVVDLAKAFEQARGPKADYWKNPELWKRIAAAGKLDELVKMFEANAIANPNDPAAHLELAHAYLSAIQMDSTKGPTYGLKSDQVLDRVLELDDKNWDARFTKAVSYSFWPDFLGKKKEAMAQFDRLVQQQDTMPVEASQAQTYLFYGNLLDQAGQGDRAREIWQRGLNRHPDNADLRRRLGQ